jgi:hypothetical protein
MAVINDATATTQSKIVLSFDFSDNSVAASATKGTFHIIVNVLPEHTSGMVRIIASPPAAMAVFFAPETCSFQKIVKNQIKCGFKFTTQGVWSVHAQYEAAAKGKITSNAVARLRVER